MSLERETLEQVFNSDMPLSVIRDFYPDDKTFAIAMHALLRNGDVRLVSDGVEVPRWRWRELFEAGGIKKELSRFRLEITEQGARLVS